MDRKRFGEVRSGGHKCNGCGLVIKRYHVDHIHPRSRSGTNDPENLQILCAFCNLSKGALTMREWCAIPNTRGYLFWRHREDLVPRGRTRDLIEQQYVEKFDEALAAKVLWDKSVDLIGGSAVVDEYFPLLYRMKINDAFERIYTVNLFNLIALDGGKSSLQEVRKRAQEWSGGDWNSWPPDNWREDPREKKFGPGLESQLKIIIRAQCQSPPTL